MGAIGDAYAGGRTRITEVACGLDPAQQQQRVGACPEWRVHDLISHVAGVCADILAGNLEGVATDAWTGAQVDARRHLPLEEVLAEWEVSGPKVEEVVDAFGPAGHQLIFDLVTHEHDLRAAVGAQGARDSDAVLVAFDFITPGLSRAVAERGLPALSVTTPDRQVVLGEGEPAVRLTASTFDVLRFASGRRTEDEIRALGWDGDATPYLHLCEVGPFTVPTTSVGD